MVMQCSVEDFGAGQSKLSAPQDSLESLFAPAVPEPAGKIQSILDKSMAPVIITPDNGDGKSPQGVSAERGPWM